METSVALMFLPSYGLRGVGYAGGRQSCASEHACLVSQGRYEQSGTFSNEMGAHLKHSHSAAPELLDS